MTWRRIAVELGRVHAVTLTSTAGTVAQTTPLTAIQQSIVDACGVTPGCQAFAAAAARANPASPTCTQPDQA